MLLEKLPSDGFQPLEHTSSVMVLAGFLYCLVCGMQLLSILFILAPQCLLGRSYCADPQLNTAMRLFPWGSQ